ILPVLILIMLVCIDYGRFAATYVAVTNAARAAAGFGITHPVNASDPNALATWVSQVQQRGRDELTGQNGCDPARLTMTPTILVQSNSRRIRVVAQYDAFQTIVAYPGLPSSVIMTRSVEMPAIR